MTNWFSRSEWLTLFRVGRVRTARRVRPTPRGFRLTLDALEARENPVFVGGVNLAVGDVNGDSYPDIVVSHASNGTPLVRVIDGATGTKILDFFAYEQSFTGGVYVACGDVDGDGIDEIITGTGNTGGPNVSVFNGKTGEALFGFFPYEDSFRGGVIVAAADTNGDGIDEIITGTGVGGGPRVQVIDGRTKETKANFFAYENSFRGGVLVGAGDLDGDGKDEIITGTGVGGGPRVQAFNAANLEPTVNFFAYENSFRGGVLIGAGDLDGDGKDEVLTGTGVGGGPVVTAFQASDASEAARFLAFNENFRGGVGISGYDLTGDGKAEMIASTGPGGNPAVSIYSSDGKTQIRTFSPFDPEQFPDAQISVPTGKGEDPTRELQAPGLQASVSQVLVGSNEQITFSARANSSATPTRVQLYASNSSGAQGEYLFDLFDDGDFTHRDPFAKDSVFSNVVSVNYASVSTNYYLAKITVDDQTQTYTAQVKAVNQPSSTDSTAANNLLTSTQTQLNSLIQGGTSVTAALNQVAMSLNANSLVEPGTVRIDEPEVVWMTKAGISGAASSNVNSNATELKNPDLDDPSSCGCNLVQTPPSADLSLSSGDLSGDLADPANCQGKVLLLAPYSFQPNIGMVGMDTASKAFQNKNWNVTFKSNATENAATVTVSDFKNLHQYDAVVITTHGVNDAGTGNTTMFYTGEKVTAGRDAVYASDLAANRLVKRGGVYCVTPSFISYHSGRMNGTVVYVAACRGARTTDMARAFLNLGAASYSGYSDNVAANFAKDRTLSTVNHFLNGGTVGTIPGVGDVEPQPDDKPARFRLFRRTANINAKLSPQCEELSQYDLRVTYTWSASQKDLDTGTTFVGQSVGYACGTSQYMTFSGDDTSTGGRETITVKLSAAHAAGLWSNSVPVSLRAGWYSPAKGSGPATVTVSLVNRETGEQRNSLQRTINPGSQSGCATTVVGTVTVKATGAAGSEAVTFTLA